MHYVVPKMKLITQDKDMSCWFASGQMLIEWRRAQTLMCEAAHPDPALVQRWSRLYDENPGIVNREIPAFAADLGLEMVPPMSPTPQAIHGWLATYGPLWVNGKSHITVIAGIRDTGPETDVLVYDPAPAFASHQQGQWRSLRQWYVLDPHSGRDTAADVATVFLHAPSL